MWQEDKEYKEGGAGGDAGFLVFSDYLHAPSSCSASGGGGGGEGGAAAFMMAATVRNVPLPSSSTGGGRDLVTGGGCGVDGLGSVEAGSEGRGGARRRHALILKSNL